MLSVFGLLVLCVAAAADTYDEKFVSTKLKDGSTHIHFEFTQTHPAENALDFDTFPRHISALLSSSELSGAHISLTRGRYMFDNWGAPEIASNAPQGSEILLFFEKDFEQTGGYLANALDSLAGLFCASVVKSTRVSGKALPSTDFRKAFFGLDDFAEFELENAFAFYGTLETEPVCTENLSPFLRLLPCKQKAGLAALIDPKVVFSAPYHSLTVHALRNGKTVKLVQTLDFVLPAGSKALVPDSVPKCPFARSSEKVNVAEIAVSHPIAINRFLTGFGQVSGGLLTKIVNSGEEKTVRVFQQLPYWIKPYFWKMQSEGGKVVDTNVHKHNDTVFEFTASVPAGGVFTLEVPFKFGFIHIAEYPPDVHRGWDFPAAMAVVDGRKVYTEGLLASIPMPDFSMPYNVITFSCTIIAMLFGWTLQNLMRRWGTAYVNGEFTSQRPIVRVVQKIKGVFLKIGSKLFRRGGKDKTD